jgi:competence protein ComEC
LKITKPLAWFLLFTAALLLLSCNTFPTHAPLPEGILQVHFIDVGQGDAVLILTPDGKAGLIDGGESGSGTRQYLRDKGVKRLDLLVATHPHDDHIGGLPEILKAVPVARVATNGEAHTTSSYENFLDAVISAKADYIEVKQGDKLELGEITLQVLHPGDRFVQSMNENSVVLRLEYGKISFLFMGDAEKGAESRLVSDRAALQADILKVGHHGSRSSSTLPFLEAVRPSIAVYSAKSGNKYGHPHPESLQSLASVGTMVYGTDIHGTVVVTTDGQTFQVETKRRETVEALSLQILSVTSPVAPGGDASVRIKTIPGANAQIRVHTKSGVSQAKGLEDSPADKDGYVVWNWKVGSSTAEGTWRIEISASLGFEKIIEETSYTVKR